MSRRLRPLPDAHAAPILHLVQITRGASADPDHPAPWAAAEAGQTAIRTGHKAARRTASAGQYAAHVVLHRAAGHVAVRRHELADAINSWDPHQRVAAGEDLAVRLLLEGDDEHTTGLWLVARWLLAPIGPALLAPTADLCRYVLEHPRVDVEDLQRAWHATHGHRLAARPCAS